MEKYALIFPGQGAQFIGMGKEFYDKYDFVSDIYDRADKNLGYKISDICFNGPEESLRDTKYSQPAILTTSIAYFQVLRKYRDGIINPCVVSGLSLGEYSALVVSEVLSFEDALKIVCKRGEFMEEAGKINPGAMLSVLGLDKKVLEEICNKIENDGGLCCQIANLNCPGQIVLSGDKESIAKADILCKEVKARKTIMLNVSGAFHSKLMELAGEKLKAELNKYNFSKPKYNFINNVHADYSDNPEKIKNNLIKQVSSSVLWEDSIQKIIQEGCTKFIEVGPGKVLKGLLRRIDKTVSVSGIK